MIFKDEKDNEWEIRFSIPSFIKICRKLKLKLNQLTTMNVELADLLEAIPILLDKQLQEKKMLPEQFWEELSINDTLLLINTLCKAVGEAFPQAAGKMGELMTPSGEGSPDGEKAGK